MLDKKRLINGQIFDEDYFEHLISEIQETRASERRFYQKITDIYATAVDYSFIVGNFNCSLNSSIHRFLLGQQSLPDAEANTYFDDEYVS